MTYTLHLSERELTDMVKIMDYGIDMLEYPEDEAEELELKRYKHFQRL